MYWFAINMTLDMNVTIYVIYFDKLKYNWCLEIDLGCSLKNLFFIAVEWKYQPTYTSVYLLIMAKPWKIHKINIFNIKYMFCALMLAYVKLLCHTDINYNLLGWDRLHITWQYWDGLPVTVVEAAIQIAQFQTRGKKG